MKKTGIITAVYLLFISLTVNAQNYKFGLGVRLSSNDAAVNNSVFLKYFLGESTAFEGLLSFGGPFAVGMMLEKHKPLVTDLRFFYGGGIYFAFSGTRNIGGQGVIGLDYKFPTIPINFSLDWKPELNFAKEFSFEPAAVGLSARFTLK